MKRNNENEEELPDKKKQKEEPPLSIFEEAQILFEESKKYNMTKKTQKKYENLEKIYKEPSVFCIAPIARPNVGKSTIIATLLLDFNLDLLYKTKDGEHICTPTTVGSRDTSQGTTEVPICFCYDDKNPRLEVEYCTKEEWAKRIDYICEDVNIELELKKELEDSVPFIEEKYKQLQLKQIIIKYNTNSPMTPEALQKAKQTIFKIPTLKKSENAMIKQYIVYYPFPFLKRYQERYGNLQIIDTPGHTDKANSGIQRYFEEFNRLILPQIDMIFLLFEGKGLLEDDTLGLLHDYGAFKDPQKVPIIIPTLNDRNAKSYYNNTSSLINDWYDKKFKKSLVDSCARVFNCEISDVDRSNFNPKYKRDIYAKSSIINKICSHDDGWIFFESCNIKTCSIGKIKEYDSKERLNELITKYFEKKVQIKKETIEYESMALIVEISINISNINRRKAPKDVLVSWKKQKGYNSLKVKNFKTYINQKIKSIELSWESLKDTFEQNMIRDTKRFYFIKNIFEKIGYFILSSIDKMIKFFEKKTKIKEVVKSEFAKSIVEQLYDKKRHFEFSKHDSIFKDVELFSKSYKENIIENVQDILDIKISEELENVKGFKSKVHEKIKKYEENNKKIENKSTNIEEKKLDDSYPNIKRKTVKKSQVVFPNEHVESFSDLYSSKALFSNDLFKNANFLNSNFCKVSNILQNTKIEETTKKNSVQINYSQKEIHFQIQPDLKKKLIDLDCKVKKLRYSSSVDEPFKQTTPVLSPIIIPSNLRSSSPPNLYIDQLIERNVEFAVVCVIEEHELQVYENEFKKHLNKGYLWFLTLPSHKDPLDRIGIGRVKTLIGLFVDKLNLSFYHLLDDDLENFQEYIKDQRKWVPQKNSFVRALLYAQFTMFHELSNNDEIKFELKEYFKQLLPQDYENLQIEWKKQKNQIIESDYLDEMTNLYQSIIKNELSQSLDLILNQLHIIELYMKGPVILKIKDIFKSKEKCKIGQVSILNSKFNMNFSVKKDYHEYYDQLSSFDSPTYDLKLSRKHYNYVNAELIRGIYHVTDEVLFDKLIDYTTLLNHHKKRESQKYKHLIKEKPTFDEKKYESIKILAVNGYYYNDDMFVKKLAFNGIGGYQIFYFSFSEKDQPSICKGNVFLMDKIKDDSEIDDSDEEVIIAFNE